MSGLMRAEELHGLELHGVEQHALEPHGLDRETRNEFDKPKIARKPTGHITSPGGDPTIGATSIVCKVLRRYGTGFDCSGPVILG